MSLSDALLSKALGGGGASSSVWTEKNTRVILENQTVKGRLDLTTNKYFDVGETVTVVWDGVAYERVARDLTGTYATPYVGEIAYMEELSPTGEPFGVLCQPDFNVVQVFSCNGYQLETENTHTVSVYVYEEVVKTNCDFVVDLTVHMDADGNEELDGKLMSGDFATAKAKILKGLPVSAFMRSFASFYDDDRPAKEISSEVVGLFYYERVDYDDPSTTYMELRCTGSLTGWGYSILPDNSLRF